MRPIGQLQDENQARRLGDLLSAQGIENQVDPDLHGSWEVWVLDDDHVAAAQRLFQDFTQHPDDPQFARAAVSVSEKKQDQEQAPGRARVVNTWTLFHYSPPVPIGILTIILIVISVAVGLLTKLGEDNRFVQPLSITEYQVTGRHLQWEAGLPEIRHGQLWRIFTPMFLHFGALHILFNMLWLRDLGSMIEARKSLWLLLVLVLVIAGVSNLAEYLVTGRPNFGGMSGVVYGLLGYIWMQGRFNPASKLALEPQTVIFMLVWFFLCLFDVVGGVANTVHAVGLGLGVAWGFLAARLSIALRRG